MARRIGLTKPHGKNTDLSPKEIPQNETRSPFHPLFALPKVLLQGLQSQGIERFHDWQKECLLLPGMLNSCANLLYSAPTSGGKTLVAEILMIKRLLEERKRAMVILPYISIVNELTAKLKRHYPDLLIAGFFGSQAGPAFEDVDIAVCTIEKANNIVNRLIEENRMDLLSTVVADELHLIGNEGRGYILELLITKLKLSPFDVKIIGMSATLPNIQALSNWLNAQLYVTEFRPVPLVEYIKVENCIYSKVGSPVRKLPVDPLEAKKLGDPDILVPIVHEVVQEGSSVLIFCAKKVDCENCSRNLSRLMVVQYDDEFLFKIMEARKAVIDDLLQTPSGLDPILAQTIPNGIAYHHSGLTAEERIIIEEAFRNGILCVICATSTLGSGVNLPARRVIFRSPFVGRTFLDVLEYNQMKGRAGRFGLDTHGESIIMCSKRDLQKCVDLIGCSSKSLESRLGSSPTGMNRAVLEVVANGLADTRNGVVLYLQNTFLFHQAIDEGIQGLEACNQSMTFLLENDFLCLDKRLNVLSPTPLGVACVASTLDPKECVIIFKELKRSLSHFVLYDELHLLYHITPALYKPAFTDWRKLFQVYLNLKEEHRQVADVIGIQEGFLLNLSQGFTTKDSDRIQNHIRFFNSMIIYDLIHEKSFTDIADLYGTDRGSIQNLQTLASTYAGMIKILCSKLQFTFFDVLISAIQERLIFGAEGEILILGRVQGIDRKIARILHDAGFKNPKDLAHSDAKDIYTSLKQQFGELADSVVFKRAREIQQNAKDYINNL